MFRSIANDEPAHLLDARLFAFAGMQATWTQDPEGDIAFDAPTLAVDVPQAVNFQVEPD